MDIVEALTPSAGSDCELSIRSISEKPKRKRLCISLATKETIIQECEVALQENISFRKLAKKWEINPQTLSHIWKSRDKILELIQNGSSKKRSSLSSPVNNKPLDSFQQSFQSESALQNCSNVHQSLISSMENVIITWVDEQTARDIPVTKSKLREMAKLLYSNYETKLKPEARCDFEADTTWFRNFIRRFKIKHKLKELVAQKNNLDDKPTRDFIAKFEHMVSQGKYHPEQIFSVDEVGFKWKINGKYQEQVILLIGGNASGDFKLKPLMINYTETPKALLHVHRTTLPVTYRSNKALRMNNDIFTKWFRKCFIPQVKEYLVSKNMENKALLLIDSVPAHSKTLGFGNKVKVLSIPPLVSCKIHPMVSSDLRNALLNAYLQRTMKMATHYLDTVVKEDNSKPELVDFWKSYNIKHCIDHIGQAWNEDVTSKSIVNAWKKVYPSNPSINTKIPTLTNSIEQPTELVDEQLTNAFNPLRSTFSDDLIDYFEIHSDLVEQYMVGDFQHQLRNGNSLDSYSFTSSPDISELSTTSSSLFQSSLSLSMNQPQPFTSQSSASSSVSSFPTTTISSNSTSEGISHFRKVIPEPVNSMKRPLLQQALLNGSKSVKLNGHVSSPVNFSIEQNGTSTSESKSSKELTELSPVLRAESDALSRKLKNMMGRDRFLLLLRVINLPEHKVNIARKLMRLIDSDECDGRKLGLTKVAENSELLTILMKDYNSLQVKKEIELPAKPNVIPFQNSKSHFNSFVNSNDLPAVLQNSFPNFTMFANSYLNSNSHEDSCPRLSSILNSHSHENSQPLENESST